MFSSRNRTWSLALALGLGTLTFTGCGSDAEKELPLYKTDAIDEQADRLSDALGVPVVLAATNDFDGEYRTAFVMRELAKRQDKIKPLLGQVAHITLGSGFGMTRIGDKFGITLATSASVSQMIEYIRNGIDAQLVDQGLQAFENRMAVSIVDGIGLTPAQFEKFSSVLDTLASDVQFRQDSTFRNLILMDRTAVTVDGAAINVNQGASSLVRDLREILDSRMFANQHLPTLSRSLSVQISFQSGVFSGAELRRAVENLRLNETMIRTFNRRVGAMILGKRWDEKPNSNPYTLLINAFSIEADFEKAFRSFQLEPGSVSLAPYLDALSGQLEVRGLKLKSVATDLLATPENETTLKNLVQRVGQNLDVEAAKAAGMLRLQIVGDSRLEYLPASGSLIVGTNQSVESMNSALRFEPLKKQYRVVSDRMNGYAREVAISLNIMSEVAPSSSLGSEVEKVAALEAVSKWFIGTINFDVLAKTPITNLVVVKSSQTSYDYAAKKLVISLNDFTPELMKTVLVVPAPAPAPAPTPAP